MADLPLDPVQHFRHHIGRGHQQLAEGAGRRLGRAGELIKEVGDIGSDFRIRGEEPQIGVEPGSGGVVVAGPDVDVALEALGRAPDHQSDLGVGLQAHQPVDHLDPGLFQPPGPGHVTGLVEAGLELHEHRDVLPAAGRLEQGVHHRRAISGAVQGDLDGDHVRVRRRFIQVAADRGAEVVVGVVHQQVALADLGEEALVGGERPPGGEGREAICGESTGGEVPEAAPVEQPAHLVHVGLA